MFEVGKTYGYAPENNRKYKLEATYPSAAAAHVPVAERLYILEEAGRLPVGQSRRQLVLTHEMATKRLSLTKA